jgi:hypothetical protein
VTSKTEILDETAAPDPVDVWFSTTGWPQYCARIKKYGYDPVATQDDVIEITEDAGVDMKKPHRRLCVALWQELVASQR